MKLKKENKVKVALFFGGPGVEHDVSVLSAKSIFNNYDKTKIELFLLFLNKNKEWYSVDENFFINGRPGTKKINLTSFLRKNNVNLVFPIIHGEFGEDGKIQKILENMDQKFLFSGSATSALAMNKHKSKVFLEKFNIKTPKFFIVEKESLREKVKNFNFPVIFKKVDGGSSVGIFLVKNKKDLNNFILNDDFENYLAEKFIAGREISVSILGNVKPKVMAITEIIPLLGEFYDYDSKYQNDGSRHICPANFDKKMTKKIVETSLLIYEKVGCVNLARIDFLIDKNNILYFIEVNTIPGMTKHSLVPEAARYCGLDFKDFLNKLILNKQYGEKE